jgi:hypothetical protein
MMLVTNIYNGPYNGKMECPKWTFSRCPAVFTAAETLPVQPRYACTAENLTRESASNYISGSSANTVGRFQEKESGAATLLMKIEHPVS